ncbi:MAG: hypothetical protein M3Z16_10665 [Pseudomonadota bacterium]|nr:hypothetical protein [Pseudomonadota bacterium]
MPKRISAHSFSDDASEVTADLENEAAGAFAKLRDQADEWVDRLRPRVDAVADYVRDEPTRAVLISAAVGAGLMALIALAVRGNRRPYLELPAGVPSSMAGLRSAALGLADRAHGAATDALKKAQKQAQKRVDKAQKDALAAADEATSDMGDKVADLWKNLREQAAPVVQKIRPQLDAAAAYAKDEPAKTTLGVVAAGALLMGLMALLGSNDD